MKVRASAPFKAREAVYDTVKPIRQRRNVTGAEALLEKKPSD